MKKLITLLAFAPLSLAAQTTWEVEAGGSTLTPPAPYYLPMDLTITVGDIVHWNGVSGTHNVSGTLALFPANPEGFTSGMAVQNMNYSHTFTIPGFYQFHCTQMGHSTTQHGTITVMGGMSMEEMTDLGKLVLYPVPADGTLTVQVDRSQLRSAEVISVDGRVLRSVSLNGLSLGTIQVDDLATGRYLVRLTDLQDRTVVRPFVKN